AVSLINFINSNFFHSLGFFGFINIFGNWDGNIGGADKFVTPTPTPDTTETASVDNGPAPIQDGGQLAVTNTNNVGAYVLPGDTVTFFINTKNIGTGRMYGVKLRLYLMRNGQDVGGTTFTLGDIDAGRSVKLTTGLVLSKTAVGGFYTARAEAYGTTGEEATQINAYADSFFTIFANAPVATTIGNHTQHEEVLGANNLPKVSAQNDSKLLFLLFFLLGMYFVIRIIRQRKAFIAIFKNEATLYQKLSSLRMLLLL
ncbi:MAG: hypothetical protein ACREGI_02010, partial [Candidatus Levyibacteriota bacterium]